MKYISNNVTMIVDEKMGIATLGQNGKIPTFIQHQYLEELRDLLVDYFQQYYGTKTKTETVSSGSLPEKS